VPCRLEFREWQRSLLQVLRLGALGSPAQPHDQGQATAADPATLARRARANTSEGLRRSAATTEAGGRFGGVSAPYGGPTALQLGSSGGAGGAAGPLVAVPFVKIAAARLEYDQRLSRAAAKDITVRLRDQRRSMEKALGGGDRTGEEGAGDGVGFGATAGAATLHRRGKRFVVGTGDGAGDGEGNGEGDDSNSGDGVGRGGGEGGGVSGGVRRMGPTESSEARNLWAGRVGQCWARGAGDLYRTVNRTLGVEHTSTQLYIHKITISRVAAIIASHCACPFVCDARRPIYRGLCSYRSLS